MNGRTKAQGKLNNSELWGGLIGLALGVFVIWSGLKLKLGSINDPGSCYGRVHTGLLMCVSAATIIVAAITEGGPPFASSCQHTPPTEPILVIACLTAFAFA